MYVMLVVGVFAVGFVFYVTEMSRAKEVWLARTEAAELKGTNTVLADIKQGQQMQIEELTDLLEKTRVDHRTEIARMGHHHEERVDLLLGQVQTLSERLSGLKLADERIEETPVAPTVLAPRDRPYSQELHTFLTMIEFEDARIAVEEYIEVQRATGKSDEQIMDELRRGEYAQ
jgi:hypothetical protein